jgi:predicted transposase/invertase (TIGR01784 family)
VNIHQPHDKLVKKLLSDPMAARDILNLYLPKNVLAITDLSQLELQKDTFIDDEHRAYAVDLLYKTAFEGEEGYIWLLLEHQRKSDFWMPVRLFKYIAIIWDHLRTSTKQKHLPLVYPLVIYNGSQPYNHSLTLSELIKPEASRKIFNRLFAEPFCLIDLAVIEDESLRKAAQDHIQGIALLMALKHVFNKNLQTFFDQTLFNILKQLDQAGNTNAVVDLLYYLLNEGEFLDEERFWTAFHEGFSQKVENKMATIAQKMEQRGIEKGFEKGIEKGIEKKNIEVAKQLLSEKIKISDAELIALIKRLTGLPEDKIRELKKKH